MKDLGVSWGDIIPSIYGYTSGLNWSDGQAWLNNGCTAPTTVVVDPPADNSDQPPADNSDQTPAGNSNQGLVTISQPAPEPTGSVEGVTGAPVSNNPVATLPPTDTVISAPGLSGVPQTWRLALLAIAVLVASLLLVPDRVVRTRS